MNCYNVKSVAKVQDVFTATKVFALVIVIVAGMAYLLMGNTQGLSDPGKDTNYSPGDTRGIWHHRIASHR